MGSIDSQNRTENFIRQLKGSFLFKVLALIANFVSISMMIKYLGVENYGIWSTLITLMSWISLFDIGIGNGLRNKIAESFATENEKEVRYFISTSYIIITIIMFVFIVLFLIASVFISWQSLLNIKNIELQCTINIIVIFISLNFVLNLINQVFNGFQKTSLSVLNQFLFNFFVLVALVLLYKFSKPSLIYLALVYGFCLIISNLLLSIWFYRKNKIYIPHLNYFNKYYIKSLTSLSLKFFIIQIGVLVIFATDKVLITYLFGAEYTTSYDILFKLFSILTIIFSLYNTPLLSAYNDAYNKNDLTWIKYKIKSQIKTFFFLLVSSLVLCYFTSTIVNLWVGNDVIIESSLIFYMEIYILLVLFGSIFSTVLGGIGLIRLGVYQTLVEAIINLPLSYYFAVIMENGVSGILIGTIVSISFGTVISFGQVYYFIYANFKTDILTRLLR